MAERTTTLAMTPSEERSLARLVSWACTHVDGGEPEHAALRSVMAQFGAAEIGRVNAALNSSR